MKRAAYDISHGEGRPILTEENRQERWLIVEPCQNKALPPKEPWPILCCCGEALASQAELRAHACRFLTATPEMHKEDLAEKPFYP